MSNLERKKICGYDRNIIPLFENGALIIKVKIRKTKNLHTKMEVSASFGSLKTIVFIMC